MADGGEGRAKLGSPLMRHVTTCDAE